MTPKKYRNFRNEIIEKLSVWKNLSWRQKIEEFRSFVKANVSIILNGNKSVQFSDLKFMKSVESVNSLHQSIHLVDFDLEYFKKLEWENWWNALNKNNCSNQRYFSVLWADWEKLGIIWVYDANVEYDEINVSHTVVDPEYRWMWFSGKFKDLLMDTLDLPFLTLTINIDNTASINAAKKLPWIVRISDEAFERQKGKIMFRYFKN